MQQIIVGIHAVDTFLRRFPQLAIELLVMEHTSNARVQHLVQFAKTQRIPVKTVAKTFLDTTSGQLSHQGVLLYHQVMDRFSEAQLWDLLDALTEDPLLLLLDTITDPHNVGACLRTAEGAGVHAVIVPKDKSADLTPVVRKVACGAAEVIPFIQVTNLVRTMEALKQRGIWLMGTADEAEHSLYEIDLTGPLALVMGSEGKGLRRLTREHCDRLVSIPMKGAVSSLNVSVATGVCLYEVLRQRMIKSPHPNLLP